MIYISIGSNLGHRLHYLQTALSLLIQNDITIVKTSPIIETEALLKPGAPADWNKPYFNMVVAVTSPHPVETLLAILKKIEQQMGRNLSDVRWAPRIIDLDILLMDDQILDIPSCTIPHAELLNRPFLLHLLALIAPDLIYPHTGENFAAIAARKNITAPEKSLVAFPKFMGIVK